MFGKPLRFQARNIVYNVYNKIREEGVVNKTQSSILKRVVELTGVPSTTISRIITEGTSNDVKKNVNRPASNIKLLSEEAFSQIGPEEWRKCCQHIEKIEIIEMLEERFIINTSLSSSSSADKEQEMKV